MRNLKNEIVQVIKIELRARGITIKSFAKMMSVSEPTMKRWLNGQGLLLKDWGRMLHVLDLPIVEVAARVDSTTREQFEYTEQQEEALSKTPGLLAFFQQLLEGFDAKKIMARHHLSQQSTISYLKKLDDIGLIRWGKNFEFTHLREGEPRWKKSGPLARTFRSKVFRELIEVNRDSGHLQMMIYHLSLVDIQKLQEMMEEVFRFARSSERKAKALEEKRTRTIGMGVIIEEYKPDFLYSIPDKK